MGVGASSGVGGVWGWSGSTGHSVLNLNTALSLPGMGSLETAWAHTSRPAVVRTCLMRGLEPPGAQEGTAGVAEEVGVGVEVGVRKVGVAEEVAVGWGGPLGARMVGEEVGRGRGEGWGWAGVAW